MAESSAFVYRKIVVSRHSARCAAPLVQPRRLALLPAMQAGCLEVFISRSIAVSVPESEGQLFRAFVFPQTDRDRFIAAAKGRASKRAGDSFSRSCAMNASGLRFPPAFAAEVIEKGSVTLDGISLTINACGKDFLTVNVIPDTQKRTTMLHWRPGSRVNMETDLIGKYVRRIMQCQADGPAAPQKSSGINKEFLLQNGFL